jgi:hypothetical protein
MALLPLLTAFDHWGANVERIDQRDVGVGHDKGLVGVLPLLPGLVGGRQRAPIL